MTYLIENKNVIEEKINIKGIPCLRIKPRLAEGKLATIIFYHGWGSNKEGQRFRGFILASLGYQVIIPDALYHGERNSIDIHNEDNKGEEFWETILKNMEESKDIIDRSIEIYDMDPDNIGVMGHSMGGFTSTGILTHDKRIKTAVILNGSFNWQLSNKIFLQRLDVDLVVPEEEKISQNDPMNHFDKIINRSILMLNGASDKLVDVGPQTIFYDKIKDKYKDKSKIKLIKYNHVGHFVTTNMMEDAARWLEINLK